MFLHVIMNNLIPGDYNCIERDGNVPQPQQSQPQMYQHAKNGAYCVNVHIVLTSIL